MATDLDPVSRSIDDAEQRLRHLFVRSGFADTRVRVVSSPRAFHVAAGDLIREAVDNPIDTSAWLPLPLLLAFEGGFALPELDPDPMPGTVLGDLLFPAQIATPTRMESVRPVPPRARTRKGGPSRRRPGKRVRRRASVLHRGPWWRLSMVSGYHNLLVNPAARVACRLRFLGESTYDRVLRIVLEDIHARFEGLFCLLLSRDRKEAIGVLAPVEVCTEEGRLSCTEGPALRFPDGDAYWFLRGGPLDPVIGARLAARSLSAADILATPNAEVRTALIRALGRDRALENARLIDTWINPTTSDPVRLWRLDPVRSKDPPVAVLELINSTPEPDGTRKVYLSAVPPHFRKALRAYAWMWDVSPTVASRTAVET